MSPEQSKPSDTGTAIPTESFAPIVDRRTRLLMVGVNPGLSSGRVGAPFAHPSNRFWRALAGAGVLDRVIDTSRGLQPEDRELVLSHGLGITALVQRPTSAASELASAELVSGVDRLRVLAGDVRPTVTVILGTDAYRRAFETKRVSLGRQVSAFEGSELWVVPNPSGRNSRWSLEDLIGAYREPAVAAGLLAP